MTDTIDDVAADPVEQVPAVPALQRVVAERWWPRPGRGRRVGWP